jgi:hypothetical protein
MTGKPIERIGVFSDIVKGQKEYGDLKAMAKPKTHRHRTFDTDTQIAQTQHCPQPPVRAIQGKVGTKLMSTRRLIQCLVAIILVLLGVVAYTAYRLRGGSGDSPGPTALVTNTVKQIAVHKVTSTNVFSTVMNRLHWASIESTNYSTYINNLRSIGCPEETVRDIIITDIAKLFAKRRAAVRAQVQPFKFWQTGDALQNDYSSNPELQRQLQELDKEQRALVKQLLGVDYHAELSRYLFDENYEDRMYGFLPAEKQETLKNLQSKFDDLEQQIYARSKGMLLDEDQEQLRRIAKDREAELAKVLSPEELEEYELRNSSTANSMRAQMTGFQPNEDEFRRIFRLQKTFDNEFSQAFDLTDEAQTEVKARAQQDAQLALNDEVKKILGEKRFTEYQRSQDPDYRTLSQVADRFDLAPDVVSRVYGMKQEAERQKSAIESNPNLTDEQRQAALSGIARETERSVAKEMGGVFKSYFKTGGNWIRNLGMPEEQQ